MTEESADSPEQLGPFRLVRLLGKGGMGTVYEGVHEKTDARVAVKVMAEQVGRSYRERFAKEIEVLKSLSHDNIVSLTGYGEQDGQLFFTMELIDGPSLQDELNRGRKFSWQEAVAIGIDVCNALKHAHDRGIVHRDLKPANLLLNGDQQVKLADFGIARIYGANQQTAIGAVIGTADYMAPEQAQGHPATIRSDLYSLGSVMYALLAERPPFKAASRTGVLHQLIHDAPKPVRRFAPGVPRELEWILDELLEKDPQRRVATALALSNQLKALQHALTRESADDDDSFEEGPLDDTDGGFTVDGDEASPTGTIEVDSRYWKETVAAEDSTTRLGTEVDDSARTHFTTLDEERRGRQQAVESPLHRRELWSKLATTLCLVAALLGLVWLVLYMLRPPSANRLFTTIEAAAREKDPDALGNARQAMSDFIRRFPTDPRVEQVVSWQLDYVYYRLWRDLERESRRLGGPEYLPPLERDFVLARRLVETNPAGAAAALNRLVEAAQSEPPPPGKARECVVAAKHLLAQLDAASRAGE